MGLRGIIDGLVFGKLDADLVGHSDPVGVVDVVEIEEGAGCLALNDVNGFGVFGEGRKIQSVAVVLAAALEVQFVGGERNVHRLEERVAHIAACWPDERQRMHLDPAAIDIVVGGLVIEVYAGVGVGELNASDAEFV